MEDGRDAPLEQQDSDPRANDEQYISRDLKRKLNNKKIEFKSDLRQAYHHQRTGVHHRKLTSSVRIPDHLETASELFSSGTRGGP